MGPTYPKLMGVRPTPAPPPPTAMELSIHHETPPSPPTAMELSIHHEILNVKALKVDLVYLVTLFRCYSHYKPKAYICIVVNLCNK